MQIQHLQTEDITAVKSLLKETYHLHDDFLNLWFTTYFNPQHTLCIKENSALASVLFFEPMQHGETAGLYIHSVVTATPFRGKGYMNTLLSELEKQSTSQGLSFLILVPKHGMMADIYKRKGFTEETYLRRFETAIRPNLIASAEQDSLTATGLYDIRKTYMKNAIQPAKEGYPFFMASIYAAGGTVLKSNKGYGVYYKQNGELFFSELFAQTERDAVELLQAARNITGCFTAKVTVAPYTELFIGEGKREIYGLLKPLNGFTYNSEDAYFNLLNS